MVMTRGGDQIKGQLKVAQKFHAMEPPPASSMKGLLDLKGTHVGLNAEVYVHTYIHIRYTYTCIDLYVTKRYTYLYIHMRSDNPYGLHRESKPPD